MRQISFHQRQQVVEVAHVKYVARVAHHHVVHKVLQKKSPEV